MPDVDSSVEKSDSEESDQEKNEAPKAVTQSNTKKQDQQSAGTDTKRVVTQNALEDVTHLLCPLIGQPLCGEGLLFSLLQFHFEQSHTDLVLSQPAFFVHKPYPGSSHNQSRKTRDRFS